MTIGFGHHIHWIGCHALGMLLQPLDSVSHIRNAVTFIGLGVVHWEWFCLHRIWCHALGMLSQPLDSVSCIGNSGMLL